MSKEDRRPIDALGLPSRVVGALTMEGIKTLGELRGYTEVGLRRIPNLGYLSLSQIAAAIAAIDRGEAPPECPRQSSPHAKPERNAAVYDRIAAGEPIPDIASSLGLARSRVHQIYHKEAHRRRVDAQRVLWRGAGDDDAA